MNNATSRKPSIRMIRQRAGIALATLLSLIWVLEAESFPAAGHLDGTDELGGIHALRGTPAGQGGIGSMSPEKAKSVTEWMDNPATRLGRTRNRKAGGNVLSAWNHRAQRHNPVATARALSGDGTINREVLNAARVHKLGDIASGRAPVDGRVITPEMQREARSILRYVREFKHLPEDVKLPFWLDNSAATVSRKAGSSGAVRSVATSAQAGAAQAATSTGSRGATALRVGGKALGAGLLVGVTACEVYGTEKAYQRGEFSETDRNVSHSATAGGTVGALGGAKAGGALGAAIGTVVCPGIGTAVGGVVGSAAGGISGYMAGRKATVWVAQQWLKE